MASGRWIGGTAQPIKAGAPHPVPGLFGLQVFVVEDEPAVLMMLEDMLAEFGCVVAGVAATVTQALSQIRSGEGIDAAILDVNLGDEKIFPVADALVRRHVPVVFSTGYGTADLARRYPSSRMLQKPYAAEALAEVLMDVMRGAAH